MAVYLHRSLYCCRMSNIIMIHQFPCSKEILKNVSGIWRRLVSTVPPSLLKVRANQRERGRRREGGGEKRPCIIDSFFLLLQISVMVTCVPFIPSSTTCPTSRRWPRKVVVGVATGKEGAGPQHHGLPAPSPLVSSPLSLSPPPPGVARGSQHHPSYPLHPAPPLSLTGQLVALQLRQLGRAQVRETA